MEEEIQKEFEELQNLEKEGLLDETQTARLEELKIEAEKAAKIKEPEKAEKSKELQSAIAQKEHWREKAEEFEAKVSELEEKTKPKKEISQDEWKSKVDFLMEHKDYSEEEFNHISTVAKEFDISLDEAAELEGDYIQYRREKVAKEKKIPEPSSPSFETKGLTPEEIGKMSDEEHRKLWEEDLKKQEESEGI